MKKHVAFIRESDCIGCAKCLSACPVDAIIGAQHWMHTVITDECTGCKRCVAPCPVDCIEMHEIEIDDYSPEEKIHWRDHYRKRYFGQKERLRLEKEIELQKAKNLIHPSLQKGLIEAAIARAKKKL